MARKSEPESEIHALTVAEVSRQIGMYSQKRRAVSAELAAIFSAQQLAGRPTDQPLTDHVKSVRERAKTLLNGHAAALLTLPPATTREQELRVEVDALDLVLG